MGKNEETTCKRDQICYVDNERQRSIQNRKRTVHRGVQFEISNALDITAKFTDWQFTENIKRSAEAKPNVFLLQISSPVFNKRRNA